MPWEYSQSTGRLAHNGHSVASGYSGTGAGRNNANADNYANIGPIPRGEYDVGAMHNTATHGPHVMALIPHQGNDMHGRSGFLIHGDNSRHDASTGCIILGPTIRNRINSSGDRRLTVVR
jgi:hypothetical protein